MLCAHSCSRWLGFREVERTKLIRGRSGEASGLRCAEGVVSGSLKSSEQRDFRRTSPTQTMGAQRPINIDDESLPAPPCLDRPRQPKSRKPNKNGVFSLSRAEPLKHAPPRSAIHNVCNKLGRTLEPGCPTAHRSVSRTTYSSLLNLI